MKLILLASLLTCGAALSATAQTPLGILKAKPAPVLPVAFEMSYTNNELTGRMRVDSSKPMGERLELISPAVDTLDKDAKEKLKQLQKHTEGNVWCGTIADSIPSDAVVLRETPETVTYSYVPIPDEDDKLMKRAAEYLQGTVTIRRNDPVVLSYSIIAPETFKPVVVAKIESFNMSVVCQPTSIGETAIETIAFDVSGSAMMKPIDETEQRSLGEITVLDTPAP